MTDRRDGRPLPASSAGRGPAAGADATGRLDGTAWTVARYLDGGALADIPAEVHADLVFAAGGVSGSAGCNRYTGAFDASGDAIVFGPLATTLMACPPPASEVEAAYLAALRAVTAYAVTADRLVLLDASGAAVVEYTAVPRDAYLGSWSGRMVNDGRQAVASLEAGSEITLQLREDGGASGNATCNRYMGSYTVDGRAIAFGRLAATRMACATPELAAQEQAYLAALGLAAAWEVRADVLELRDAGGALQASFGRA
jgi:heat shock protein HslJ